MEGGVGKKSCAQSDSNNLKIVPIIENVEETGDTAVCYVMILEERRLSDDALNFPYSTPNHSNIWRQETKLKSSKEIVLAKPNGETARSLEGDNGSGGDC
jgi:hypothetical protein